MVQTEVEQMNPPPSPFLEDLEVRALEFAILKPEIWLRYADDIFIIWKYEENEFNK